MITAHARTSPEQDRAFVFNNCTITGEQGARIYFGRPWRDYAAVIFMNTKVEGELDPEGWREWTPGKTDRLKLAYYAEFNTQGRSSDMSKRQSYTKVLSAAEAQRWSLPAFFAGSDGWNPRGEDWKEKAHRRSDPRGGLSEHHRCINARWPPRKRSLRALPLPIADDLPFTTTGALSGS